MTFEKRIAIERAFRLGVSPRASAAPGAWIVQTPGAGGGGGGTVILPAPAVTINPPAEVIPRSNGKIELDVFWTKGATAGPSNFTGVAVYVEDPDISTGTTAPLDGTTQLDGTAQSSGAWQPVLANNSTKSPASVVLDAGVADRKVRIYLAAYGPYTQPHLVRATDSGPTPNIVVDVPGANTGASGQEYAFLATNTTVQVLTDYNRPDPNYNLLFSYTPPDPAIPIPPNLQPFGGCRIYYVPANSDDTNPQYGQRTDSGLDISVLSDAGFKSPIYTPAPQGGSFRCYFCSEDIDGHTNSVVAGVTPYALAVVPPVSIAPPDVTAFSISGQKIKWQLNGAFVAEAIFAWNIPASARYAGVFLYLVNVTGTVLPLTAAPIALTAQQSNSAVNFQYDTANIPPGQEVWTIAAISVDVNGVLADDPTKFGQAGFHSPTVTWNIGPPQSGTPGGGQEYAPLVSIDSGATATATTTLSSDGVSMVSFQVGNWTDPVSNQFGAAQVAMVVNNDPTKPTYWDVPGLAKSFTTPKMPSFGNIGSPVPVDFYIVSVDPQGNRNSLIPGTTPKISITYTPTSGAIIPARTGWFDPTQFKWDTGGLFLGQAFSANIIQVGSTLIVGGSPSASFGGQQNGQIAVEDSGGNLVGWIGTQNAGNHTTPGYFGAWFKQLWVGGTQPTNAPLFIDNQGIIEVGGIAAATGGSYPYISIRDAGGVEKGRIGAGLTIPSGPGDSVGINPPSGLTAGAWFTQLAIGGQNLSNWQILITPDTTANSSKNPYGSIVQMRYINLITIDYPLNSAPAGSNYEYRMDFGNSVWMAGGLPNGTYSFPGIHLYEVDNAGNNFGATFLNRGMVLRGTNTQGYPVLASLVAFNGDSTGGETEQHFYSQLTMRSPFAPYDITISISSGSDQNNATPSIYPYILMWDTNHNFLASLDHNGVTSANGFRCQNYNGGATGNMVIDPTGHWLGVPMAGGSQTPWTSDIAGAGHNLSGVGTISCASLSCTTVVAGSGGSVTAPFVSLTPAGSNPSIIINSRLCCDYAGNWTSGVATTAYGVGALGFSVWLGSSWGTGQTVTVSFTAGFSIGGPTYHNLVFNGGILIGYS